MSPETMSIVLSGPRCKCAKFEDFARAMNGRSRNVLGRAELGG